MNNDTSKLLIIAILLIAAVIVGAVILAKATSLRPDTKSISERVTLKTGVRL